MKLKQFLLAVTMVFTAASASAHALWIETNASGKAGQAQDVKIFYGEYAENERDSVAKWYSDIRQLTLWLIAPDGKRTKLDCMPGVIHLSASFTPAMEGNYTLSISHDTKDFPGTMRYQFNTNASVTVGKSTPDTFKGNDIHVTATPQNGKVAIKAYLNGTPAANMHVEVVSPEGWRKTFVADKNGELAFTPTWKGRYMLEVTDTEKKAGTLAGKNYESTWRCSTNSFVWK